MHGIKVINSVMLMISKLSEIGKLLYYCETNTESFNYLLCIKMIIIKSGKYKLGQGIKTLGYGIQSSEWLNLINVL